MYVKKAGEKRKKKKDFRFVQLLFIRLSQWLSPED
jgi:hypothetical protein